MLDDSQRAIIKATVPLLETGGEALTTHFYAMMLDEYPEVRPLFNPAHQASGAQPRALANAVLMYARHIDRLEQLGGLVGQIINKHVALQILPEHYPIVGTCLLRAIREVLGEDIATPAVVEAWAAAYQQLADLLMGAEEDLYRQKAQATGGWRGARAFRLVRRERESQEIVSFYFEPVDGQPVLKAEPGQYIGLQLFIDGVEQRRNYSLSSRCDGRQYRISVKRQPDGTASNYLHDRLQVGDTVPMFPPAGDFILTNEQGPVVLISGGVGITPTLAMLETALEQGRAVTFIHCARNAAVHAFGDWVDALAARHPQLKRFYCYAESDGTPGADAIGLLDQALLERWLPRDAQVYYLGPQPFMAAVRRHLQALGVPESRMHHEHFGPAAALA
ncbi:NO-inducible flavohemoprotein [Enterobacterales bacterium AW_CKDN230030176-1A_HGKHYDSX7]